MSNFKSRVLTGAALVASMMLCIFLSKYTFFLFFAALLILSLWEFYNIFEANSRSPQRVSGVIIGLLIFVSLFLQANGYDYNEVLLLSLAFLGVIFIVINELYRKTETPFENIAITLFGVVYIAVPISLFWPIAYRENIYQYNPNLIFGYFIVVWTYDSFAYLSGMKFGKKKLFERISPKKSWEGAIGGYIFALLAAYILSIYFKELSLIQWLVSGTIISVFGTFGDLVESMLKRSLNIKDSGNILPGHGGLLDRFDAMFLAVPALYLYFQFI